ncbi:MAG: TIGR01777 family oxidoreductase [Lentisphaeraceae bacterium]|nr:TIGR01777 family oxidoreductase [Lentisphaeraceae bacterium]
MKKRKIVIAGGSGFLGKELKEHFTKQGCEVVVLARSKDEGYTQWDGETIGEWTEVLDGADVLINLCGKSVDCRYNERNKRQIFDSRTKSTGILGEAVRLAKSPPKLWMNASTATIYAHSDGEENDEETGVIGEGFSVEVAKRWEKAFFEAEAPQSIRKVCLRMTIILGKNGPFMQVMKKIVKMRLGGRQGSGEQQFSWLHLDDYLAIVDWFVENESAEGIYNLAAPNPEKNKDVMAYLRKACGVKIGLPAPELLVHLGAFIMRTEPELPLKSRCVVPKRLLDEGYRFKHENLESAFMTLV